MQSSLFYDDLELGLLHDVTEAGQPHALNESQLYPFMTAPSQSVGFLPFEQPTAPYVSQDVSQDLMHPEGGCPTAAVSQSSRASHHTQPYSPYPSPPPSRPREHPRLSSRGSGAMCLQPLASPSTPKYPSKPFYGRPWHASLRASYTRTRPHIANTTSGTTIRPTEIPIPTLAVGRNAAARRLLHIPRRLRSRYLGHRRPLSSLSDATRLYAPRPWSPPRPGNVLTARISSGTVAHPISRDTSRLIRAARKLRTGCVAGCP